MVAKVTKWRYKLYKFLSGKGLIKHINFYK